VQLPLRVVHRGDSRGPGILFVRGFQAFGRNYDLLNHLHNGPDSGYVSATLSPVRAAQFAHIAAGGAWHPDPGAWVHTIALVGSANEIFIDATQYGTLICEDEVAFRDEIPPQQIICAQEWDLVQLSDGTSEYRPIGPVIPNGSRP
jgi:hypothetical protein